MNINPFQLIQMMRSGMNPQQILMQIMPQFQNNPIAQNAMNLMQSGDTASLEKIARNLAQQKGIDFDKEFTNFKNSFR